MSIYSDLSSFKDEQIKNVKRATMRPLSKSVAEQVYFLKRVIQFERAYKTIAESLNIYQLLAKLLVL